MESRQKRSGEDRFRRGLCAALVMLCAVSGIVANNKIAPRVVVIVNNHPFRMRVPMRIRDQKLDAGTWTTSDGLPVQQVEDDAVFIAELNAATSKRLAFRHNQSVREPAILTLLPVANGVAVMYNGTDAGRLSWNVVVRDAQPALP